MVLDARFGVAKFGESYFGRLVSVATNSIVEITVSGVDNSPQVSTANNNPSISTVNNTINLRG